MNSMNHEPHCAVNDASCTCDERREIARLRDKNRELNRRCQSYEAALAEKLDETKRAGVSFGRMLANGAATMYAARIETLETALRAIADYGHAPGCDENICVICECDCRDTHPWQIARAALAPPAPAAQPFELRRDDGVLRLEEPAGPVKVGG